MIAIANLKGGTTIGGYIATHLGNLLDLIKHVDGSGSGIDSDLLDEQEGSYYLDFTNATNKPDPTITLSGDATGSCTLTDLGNATLPVSVTDDSHEHTRIKKIDDRDRKPADTAKGFGEVIFTSLGGMTGVADSDYQDMLVMNSYSDSSGGKVNALVLDKSEQKIRHYQANQTDTTWGTPKVLAYNDVATQSANGLISSTDKTKLDGIASGADVNNISDTNATDLTDGGETTLHTHNGANITQTIYTTTTATTEGYYRIATIPINTQFKQVSFRIKGYTATGTTTQSTIDVDLAYYSGNYGSQQSSVNTNTSHSYDAETNAENGWVFRYCRVSFDATSAYIDMYKYKTTAVTMEVQPLTLNDWVWATGTLTVNPTIGAYRNTVGWMPYGLIGSYIRAGSANWSGSAAYSNYGVLGGQTISNTTDKTGQWEYFGNWYFEYNASYLRGRSGNIRVRVQELSYDGSTTESNLDDFILIIKTNLVYHADSTAFNTTVPTFSIEIEGKTSLTTNDICGLVYSTSTSVKYIRFYIKLKGANTVYMINPEQRYGRSFGTSAYNQTTSYSYFSYITDQAPISALPTPAQGSVVYSTLSSSGGGGNTNSWSGTKAEYDAIIVKNPDTYYYITDELIEAQSVGYNNGTTGINATQVQDAIDKVFASIPTVPTSLPANGGNSTTVGGLGVANIARTAQKTGAQLNAITTLETGIYCTSEASVIGLSGSWWHIYHSKHVNNDGYSCQMAIEYFDTGNIYFRSSNGTTWGAWRKIITTGGATMSGILTAQSNTAYTTKQVRNIIISTADADINAMANGDIWIKV